MSEFQSLSRGFRRNGRTRGTHLDISMIHPQRMQMRQRLTNLPQNCAYQRRGQHTLASSSIPTRSPFKVTPRPQITAPATKGQYNTALLHDQRRQRAPRRDSHPHVQVTHEAQPIAAKKLSDEDAGVRACVADRAQGEDLVGRGVRQCGGDALALWLVDEFDCDGVECALVWVCCFGGNHCKSKM
ncbi:hypothetical protein BC830DRAFT_29079 [Chytriomyces sp. MP71]|nr:hypothetical protein BC830DRAFT_29079 [Chytriomyces sp. MP71]